VKRGNYAEPVDEYLRRMSGSPDGYAKVKEWLVSAFGAPSHRKLQKLAKRKQKRKR
jgi:hypothetical protein